MPTTYFPEVKKTVAFEGPDSKNPLAFRYYDAKRVVQGKTMAEHFRFAVAYWHTMKGSGADMFGPGAWKRAWNSGRTDTEIAEHTLRANFEFCTKLGVPYWCFHDRDIAPEGATFAASCKNLDKIVKSAAKLQDATGLKLLWGTANLFSNPRYTHGAGTNPDLHVFAYAAAQVKHAMDATLELGGENYVFWGGREGYETLLNTDVKHEQNTLAALLKLAVAHKKKTGFTGQFLIEPKPCEPTKHQYDFDSATVISFLREHGLFEHFKLNLEVNHATLAGHSFEHELTVATAAGRLGSVDANRGDTLLGWDTDQFPNDLDSAVRSLLIILKAGGLGSGGFNFDSKCRRGSIETVDLFHAHIGGMDLYAKALLIADKIITDKTFENFVGERYSSWKSALGTKVLTGKSSFDELETYVLKSGEPKPKSGRQEFLENQMNRYLF